MAQLEEYNCSITRLTDREAFGGPDSPRAIEVKEFTEEDFDEDEEEPEDTYARLTNASVNRPTINDKELNDKLFGSVHKESFTSDLRSKILGQFMVTNSFAKSFLSGSVLLTKSSN